MTLSFIDNLTILIRNVFTDLIFHVLTFLLVENFAVWFKVCDTLPLLHIFTFVLKSYCTLVVVLSGTFLFMNGFLDNLWNLDTLKLGSAVTFFIRDCGTFLLDVLDIIALLLVMDGTSLLVGVFLNRFLLDFTSLCLSLSTNFIRNVSTFLPGHRLIGLFGNLMANFLGNFLTGRLGFRRRTWRIVLRRRRRTIN